MNRNHRQQCRKVFERRQRAAAERRMSSVEERARREQAIRAALARCASRGVRIPYDACAECALVFERAPRLAVEPYAEAVLLLTRHRTNRSVADWQPRGKGRDALFRSLGEHLLARFPVPTVLWGAFFDWDGHTFAPLVAHVAGGGSLFDYVSTTGFPIKLTRRMCHEVLAKRSCGSLLEAIRRVQVRFAGGDERLFRAWMGTPAAQGVRTEEDEGFWFAVLGWLARIKTLEPSQVAPLVDYLQHRHDQDAEFTVSGRSLTAVMRAMHEWHRGLARERVVRDLPLPPSGYAPITLDRSTRDRDGQRLKRIWRVEEVTTARELHDEGGRMNHCVYSYLGSILNGLTSIWTMTLEDGSGGTGRWAMLTIEVRRDLRRIVQARGRFNRPATSGQLGILRAWANRNALEVSLRM